MANGTIYVGIDDHKFYAMRIFSIVGLFGLLTVRPSDHNAKVPSFLAVGDHTHKALILTTGDGHTLPAR
jgi:hypothetical protein